MPEDNEGIVFICFIEIISILAKKLVQLKQAANETASNFLPWGLKMKFFCSLTQKVFFKWCMDSIILMNTSRYKKVYHSALQAMKHESSIIDHASMEQPWLN